ncbi:MAG TPA: hypothetical protein VHX42_04230 [Candidatus Babeliales bacterium]|jgi:hypothetical protein|nr:hypothetical protein [Candidatus Babeliales bacterium]
MLKKKVLFLHLKNIKKIIFSIILITFPTVTSEKKHFYYSIAGTIAAVIIGKVVYDHIHYIPPEQIIQEWQSMLKTIQQDIDYYHALYKNDAHISNWELKEIIIETNKQPYPFLRYYTAVHKALLLLQTYYVTVTEHLSEITKHEKKLSYKKFILKLKLDGKNVQQRISQIISLLTILTMKLQSFQEYQDDHYYWKEKNE